MYHGKPVWVLTADASRAKIWAARTPSSPLELVREMESPEGRMHDRDLTSDLPGRAFDGSGSGRHIMEQEVGPKKEAAIRFSHKVADVLAEACRQSSFGRIYLAAAPSFLGLLRDSCKETLKQCDVIEVDKGYVTMAASELRSRLPEYL